MHARSGFLSRLHIPPVDRDCNPDPDADQEAWPDFDAIDANQDSVIDREEFRAALSVSPTIPTMTTRPLVLMQSPLGLSSVQAMARIE